MENKSLASRITWDKSESIEILEVDYTGLNSNQISDLMKLSWEYVFQADKSSINLLEIVSHVHIGSQSLEEVEAHITAISPYLRRYAVLGGVASILVDQFKHLNSPIRHFDSKIEAIGYLLT